MIDPLRESYERLDAGRRRFLQELRGLNAAQRSFRPRAGAWSALEVAHHVMLAEADSVETMIRLRGKASARRSFKDRLGYAAVWLVLTLGLRARLREQPAPPESDVTLDEVEGEWQAVRERLHEFLQELPREGLQQAGFKHPVAGPLSVREALLFLERHLKHHLRQLDRLRRAPGFPGNSEAL